jgi:prophage regulatory protein
MAPEKSQTARLIQIFTGPKTLGGLGEQRRFPEQEKRITMEGKSIIREKALLKLLGNPGRTTVWRWEKNGQFPRRRKLGGRSVGWLENEVLEWIASRPQVGAEE